MGRMTRERRRLPCAGYPSLRIASLGAIIRVNRIKGYCEGTACSSNWVVLPYPVLSSIEMAAIAPGHISIFVIGNNFALCEKWWNGKAWGGFRNLGGAFLFHPVSISRAANDLSVFATGKDHAIYHVHWTPRGWAKPAIVGGRSIGPPAVSHRPGGSILDIFYIGDDYAIYHKSLTGQAWEPPGKDFERLGGNFLHAPAAVSSGPNHVGVFGVGIDGFLHYASWTHESGWRPFEKLAGQWRGVPKVVSDAPGNIHVFGINDTCMLNQLSYTDSEWGPVHSLSGSWHSTPDVVTRGPGKIDIFAVGFDSAIYHAFWKGTEWSPWANYGGATKWSPKAVSHSPLHVSLFIIGWDGALSVRTTRANGTWPYEWEPLGGVCFSPAG